MPWVECKNWATVIVGPSIDNINSFVESMKTDKDNFVLTDKGDINKFLGIKITHWITQDSRFLCHVWLTES